MLYAFRGEQRRILHLKMNGELVALGIMILLSCTLLTSNFVQPTTVSTDPIINTIDNPIMSDLTPHPSILITQDSDFTNQGWPGAGTVGVPYEIANLVITPSAGSYAINISGDVTANYTIVNCSVEGSGFANGFFLNAGNARVSSCNFTDVDVAIMLDSIDNSTIDTCDAVTTGTDYAIIIDNSQNNTIASCHLYNAGMRVTDSPLTAVSLCFVWASNTTAYDVSYSENCTLNGVNVIGGLGDGIVLDHCDVANGMSGIITGVSGTGIAVLNSSDCSFLLMQSLSNNIGLLLNYTQVSTFTSFYTYDNTDSGIIVMNSDDSTFTSCSSYSNGAYGLRVDSGTGNTFYDNYLGFNVLSAAVDNGLLNLWDDGGISDIGNYWDDWGGVGDQLIPGTGGQSDHFPQHWIFPEFTSYLPERFIEYGDNDEWLTWYFQGTNPLGYMVMKNGMLIVLDLLDTDHVFVAIGSNPVGEYTFTIFLIYEGGVGIQASTVVTILPQEGPFFRGYDLITGPNANSEIIIRLEVADWTSIRYVGLTYRVNGVLTYDVNVTAVYDHSDNEGDLHIEWVDVTLPEMLDESDFIEFQGFARDDFNKWGSSEVWNFTVGPEVTSTTTTTTTTTTTATTTTSNTSTVSGVIPTELIIGGVVAGIAIIALIVVFSKRR